MSVHISIYKYNEKKLKDFIDKIKDESIFEYLEGLKKQIQKEGVHPEPLYPDFFTDEFIAERVENLKEKIAAFQKEMEEEGKARGFFEDEIREMKWAIEKPHSHILRVATTGDDYEMVQLGYSDPVLNAKIYKQAQIINEDNDDISNIDSLIEWCELYKKNDYPAEDLLSSIIQFFSPNYVSDKLYDVMIVISAIYTVYENGDIVYEDLDDSYIDPEKLTMMLNSFSTKQGKRLHQLIEEHSIDNPILKDLITLLRECKEESAGMIFDVDGDGWEKDKFDQLLTYLEG